MKYKSCLALVSMVAVLSLFGCGENVKQIKDSLDIEVGEELVFNVSDFFETSEDSIKEFVVDTSAVNTNELGNSEITVTYKGNTYKITVNVKDTTAPVVTAKEEFLAVKDGVEISASDYVDVKDKSDYNVYFVVDDSECEKITYTSDMSDSDVFDVEIIAVDSSDNKSDPITVSIPVGMSMEGCSYDASTGKYIITESVVNEFITRYPDIMSKIIGNGDLENAFYDYIFGGNVEDEIDWDVVDIVMKAFDGVEPEDFLSDAGLYKKPSTSEKKDTVSQPAETQTPTQPVPTQSNPSEDSSSGMMSDDQAAEWAGSGGVSTDFGDITYDWSGPDVEIH